MICDIYIKTCVANSLYHNLLVQQAWKCALGVSQAIPSVKSSKYWGATFSFFSGL